MDCQAKEFGGSGKAGGRSSARCHRAVGGTLHRSRATGRRRGSGALVTVCRRREGHRGMNYNLLLDWVSERASGSWRDFRNAHDWLSVEDAASYRAKASTTALVLASLGHIEVDW